MKRSEIDRYIKDAIGFFRQMKFALPPFAYCNPADWKKSDPSMREIVDLMLGWDITDFGTGDFLKTGLLLFTIRNGLLKSKTYPKPYAEKIMMVRAGQVTPMHSRPVLLRG